VRSRASAGRTAGVRDPDSAPSAGCSRAGTSFVDGRGLKRPLRTEISDEGPLPRFPVGKEKPPLLREQQAPSVRLASLVIEQDSFQSA
jgi:hypothetical protein